MKRNLSDSLKANAIRRAAPDEAQARECLKAAERDLKSAKNNLRLEDFDWTLAIAYNAMLGATRALMFHDGYSVVGEAHHKTVVEYAEVKFGEKHGGLTRFFNVLRKRRHHSVYDRAGTITCREAEEAVSKAGQFVRLVKEKVGA